VRRLDLAMREGMTEFEMRIPRYQFTIGQLVVLIAQCAVLLALPRIRGALEVFWDFTALVALLAVGVAAGVLFSRAIGFVVKTKDTLLRRGRPPERSEGIKYSTPEQT
jgi:hypothetical protein